MAEKVSGKRIFDWYHILLAIIILAQMLFVTYMFNEYKMGYHSDEIFNYGFANSYDRKEIYIDDNGEEIYNKWLPTTVLTNYITVQEGERFAYDKVYAHAAADINPPFQLFVLHTICSFFPNVYSKWFCFSINIVSLGISLIYIHKSVELISKSKVAAFGAVLLYGFSAGAQSVTVFLRLYALGVMFGTAFFYYSAAIYENINDEEKKNKYYIRLGVSLLLGAFTLHFFLPFAFAITFCYTVMYLIKRQFKVFFKYGFTCLGAVIASIVIFPSTISHLFVSNDNLGNNMHTYPFYLQVRLFVHYLVQDIMGFETDVFRGPNILTPMICVLFVVLLFVPLCFLLRKEKWFISFCTWLKKQAEFSKTKLKSFDYSIIVAMITIIFIIIISSKTTSLYRMGGYGVRYLFIVYPISVIAISTVIYFAFEVLISKKVLLNGINMFFICFIIYFNVMNNSYTFYMEHEESGITLKDIDSNANTIILLAEHWMISSLAPEMGNQNGNFFVTEIKDVEKNDYRYSNDNPLYIIVDTSYIDDSKEDYGNAGEDSFSDILLFEVPSAEELIDYYKKNMELESVEQVGYDEVFSRTFAIYKVM